MFCVTFYPSFLIYIKTLRAAANSSSVNWCLSCRSSVDDDFFQLGHQALFLQALQHNSDRRALAAHFLFKLVLVDLAIRLIGQEVDGVDLHPGQGRLAATCLDWSMLLAASLMSLRIGSIFSKLVFLSLVV